MKILPDTSAWINFFRSTSEPVSVKLRRLIEVEADLCLCGPVLTEILQGLGNNKERTRIEGILETPDYLETPREVFTQAAAIYRGCRDKGFTIRSTLDCIIAATAIHHDAHVLHKDRDYDAIARFFPLKVY